MPEKSPDMKKMKKRAKKAVVASVATAGIVVAGLFGSATELMNEDGSSPASVVELAAANDGGVQGGEDEGLPQADEKRRDVRSRMRIAILGLPPLVRVLVGLPLWGLGWFFTSVLSALWGTLLSPVLGGVLKFLWVAALLSAVLLVSLKAAFPHMKVKDILNKRSIITLVTGLALIGLGGAAAQIFYPEGQELPQLIHWLGGLALLIICAVPAIIKYSRRQRIQEATIDPDEEARRQALALADSVSR